jgi:hypothetical protein
LEPEHSIPTITGNENVPDTVISDDIPPLDEAELHIEPIVPTDELAEAASNGNAEPPPLNPASNAQNYEHYVLPSTQLLTPAAPPIELKDEELRKIAASLSEKTSEFNVQERS